MLSALATYYNPDYTYNYDYTNTQPGDVAAILTALAIIAIPAIVCIVLMIIGQWKVFQKAGKPGWAAIVPIYNIIVMLQVVGRPVWWVFLYFLGLIPFVGWIGALIVSIIVLNDLAKVFGKDVGYTLLLIFLPFVGYMMLGFGDAKYRGPLKHAS